jgi:phosphoribosylamine--glycine ligase
VKVLVVGAGGREHALAWKLAREPRVTGVLAAPGSAGIARVAECVPVAADDIEGLLCLAAERGVGMTIVGPEAPLAAGLVDRFRARGLRAFGPESEGARLESSKAFTKKLLSEAGIPTARYAEFTDRASARAFARSLGLPVVVKADGLAGGKGVAVCESDEEVDRSLADMLERGRFGAAGKRVIVEEFLRGEEASIMALTDGRTVLPLATAQDHKRVNDGDVGPNTGGMGAYSPTPLISASLAAEIRKTVLEPTVDALRARGIDYRGVLYAGIMVCDGRPKVLEYNVRFGDPECQPLMVRLESSILDLVEACVDGTLAAQDPRWKPGAAACVVMTAAGYPGDYQTGDVITGIDEAEATDAVTVFHAGTSRGADGRWLTAGGRVLGVTGSGADIGSAIARAYEGVSKISWKGAHFRRDIGHRASGRRLQEV